MVGPNLRRRQYRGLPRARQYLPAARSNDGRRFPAHPVQGDLGRSSLLQFCREPGVHHRIAQQFWRFERGAIVDATAYASKSEHRKEIAEAIAPANYLNAPGHRAGAGF